MKWFSVILLSLCCGCTDADWSKFGSLGDTHLVQLYSGGKLVRQWRSTGVVQNEEKSDGFYFKDADTGVVVRVTGDLVITPITEN